MSEFFREVDEDFRRDQILKVWKRYQNWIIGAALLVVLGTAGWRANEYFRMKADETAGAKFEAALQLLHDGKTADAAVAFEAIGRDAPKGYAALSRLVAADATAARDPEGGMKAYDALIADASFDSNLKEVAQLREAYLRLDTDTPREFEQRYAGLSTENGPYHNSLRELLAVAALKDGDDTAAGHWLDQIITDPTTPEPLRRRADAFLALVQAGKLPGK